MNTQPAAVTRCIPVVDYDLDATLSSGQAFRWDRKGAAWEGVIQGRWVSLRADDGLIRAETLAPPGDWDWLDHYLQVGVDLGKVLATFPNDEPMGRAVAACQGLRLLRQEPWECLASFILSSNKQIVQIRQMVAALSTRFGEPVPSPGGVAFAFPSASRIAAAGEDELRACKLGYRAPYLLNSARMIGAGEADLGELAKRTCEEARIELLKLPGVGRKVADCVLLFAYGFPLAFPVDVWVMRAFKELYFPRRRNVRPKTMQAFSESHFGPHGGYAQQYLFHYMRTKT